MIARNTASLVLFSTFVIWLIGCQRAPAPPVAQEESQLQPVAPSPSPNSVAEEVLEAGPSKEEIAKVAKVVQAYGGSANAPRPGAEAFGVSVFFSGDDGDFRKGTPRFTEDKVPELVRLLTEAGVPLHLRFFLRKPSGFTTETYKLFFGIPKLTVIDVENENALAALVSHPGSNNLLSLGVRTPTLQGLTFVSKFPKLRSLIITSDNLTGSGLAPAGTLTELKTLSVAGKQLTDADFAPFSNHKRMTYLTLSCPKITTGVMSHFADMTELRTIPFQLGFHPGYTDATLAHLAKLNKVEQLRLLGPEVTDVGLKHLAGMTGLKSLTIDEISKVSAEGMRVLAGLPNITELKIVGARVPTAEALAGFGRAPMVNYVQLETGRPGYLAALSTLPALEEVYVGIFDPKVNFPLSDTELEGLKSASRLRRLSFAGSIHYTDVGLAHIGTLRELTELDLSPSGQTAPSKTSISHVGMSSLAKLTKLKTLRIDARPVSDSGVAKLAELPELRFLSIGGSEFTERVATDIARFPKLEKVWLMAPAFNFRIVEHKINELTKGRVKLEDFPLKQKR